MSSESGMAQDNMSAENLMRSLLQRIATGPELSKDVSEEESRAGMEAVLQGRAHPVQAALYLIALRMKRETDEELLGIHQALIESTSTAVAEVDELVEITDPFNGYVRGLPVSPFLPAVLAACGLPAVSHGVETTGPKHGVTHHKVLAAAGEKTDLGLEEAARRIADPEIGWTYVDQSITSPELNRLGELRDLMVKRTCLTTVEVALKPLSARHRSHLVTGYVHKAYPRIYTMLARHAGYHSALIVRGVEGGVIPSLQQPSRGIRYFGGGADEAWRLDPHESGIFGAEHRSVPLPRSSTTSGATDDEPFDADIMSSRAAECGMAALRGCPGPAYDSLVYAGSIILENLGRCSRQEGAEKVRNVLDSGAAAARFG